MKRPMRALVDRGKLWVHVGGRIHRIELESKTGVAGAGEEAGELVAPFNCKVVKLHATAGAELKQGDPVVSVEAMKMEYTYSSPRDGKIAKVNVTEGQIVTEGTHFVSWVEA